MSYIVGPSRGVEGLSWKVLEVALGVELYVVGNYIRYVAGVQPDFCLIRIKLHRASAHEALRLFVKSTLHEST